MSEFSSRIQIFSQRLAIPEPARSRVLLEVGTDMEDLYHHYLDQGMEREDAVRAVEEHFDLSDEALRELVRIHASPLQQSLEGLSGQIRSPWERGVLALLALLIIVGLVPHLLQDDLLSSASPLAPGLLAILACALGVGAWKGIGLFGPGSRHNRGPVNRGGIRSLPFFSLLLLGLGLAGVWVELYRSALVIREDPAAALPQLVLWMHLASATLVIAVSGALLTGLFWYFLEARASALEQRAAATILAPGA